MRTLQYHPGLRKSYGSHHSVATWTPAVDVIEHTEDYTLFFDLPGFKKTDFTLTVKEGLLTISGERTREKTEKEDLYKYYERFYGTFERSFKLPELVDGENIKASYKNGVLQLTIPKKEEIKPRTIQIS